MAELRDHSVRFGRDLNGLPYRRFAWNDVTVEIRPASQDCLLTVNGAQAGPFPFGGFCFEPLFEFTADRCETRASVVGGGLVLADPPGRIRPGRCSDALR